jgi:hypothetical protein
MVTRNRIREQGEKIMQVEAPPPVYWQPTQQVTTADKESATDGEQKTGQEETHAGSTAAASVQSAIKCSSSANQGAADQGSQQRCSSGSKGEE